MMQYTIGIPHNDQFTMKVLFHLLNLSWKAITEQYLPMAKQAVEKLTL